MQDNNPKRREPKKTVSIEVRVSEEEKRAFMTACRTANRSVSSVLRRLMGLFVVHQHLRHRIPAMMTNFFRRPVRAAFVSVASAAAVSMSLLVTPGAAADVRLVYQIAVDDGVGPIVSMGSAEFTENAAATPVTDRLGDTVRFEFTAEACEVEAGAACPQGRTRVLLSVWDGVEGQELTVTDRGIVLAESGDTRFDSTLSDGRVLTVIFVDQTRS
jgi:hypothetical protein